MSFSRLSVHLDVKKVEHRTLGHGRIKDELLKEDGSSYKGGRPESPQEAEGAVLVQVLHANCWHRQIL